MARSKSSFVVHLEYYPLRGLLRMLQILPPALCRKACSSLLHGILFFLPNRRRLIQKQIEVSFPDFAPEEHRRIARQSVDNLAQGLAMFARIPLMTDDMMEKKVEIEGFEHIREAFRQGRGMITFTAHYGCWELMAIYVTRLYPKISMLVRPLDNPLLDAMVSAVRECGGGGVIDSRRVFKDGIRLLRDNGILGILIYQNFHKGGVFVNFFGRLACTTTGPARVARKTGVPIVLGLVIWDSKLKKYRLRFDPVEWINCQNPEEEIQVNTANFTRLLEEYIRRFPDHWLWVHRRWKTRPEGDPPLYPF